jgi:hypothetical protein
MGSSLVDELRAEFVASGGLSSADAATLYASLAEVIDRILDVERPATEALRSIGRDL